MARTREQEREHQREYRLRKAAEAHEAVAPPPVTDEPVSAVELVWAELRSLPAAKGLQSLVAAALAMARVLDDPSAVPQHPAAAGQLRRLCLGLRRRGFGRPRRGS
jgi:hypothetical protein